MRERDASAPLDRRARPLGDDREAEASAEGRRLDGGHVESGYCETLGYGALLLAKAGARRRLVDELEAASGREQLEHGAEARLRSGPERVHVDGEDAVETPA